MESSGGGGGLPRFRMGGTGPGPGSSSGKGPPSLAASPSPFGRRGAPSPSPSPSMRDSSAMGPISSAQGLGVEISHEMDALRAELHDLRVSHTALQHTNGELHSALAQVTERSKLLSSEHARFLDEFRAKSAASKQQLLNDRQALKTNLEATNTRLEDLERLNASMEGDKARVQRQLDALQHEYDTLKHSHATMQAEKQIWLRKEEEYIDIQKMQSRTLEELNATVLQIQEEREGWHARCEEATEELRRAREHTQQLETALATQEGVVSQLHSSVLTSQEEVMNLTQTLATHLEQIGSLSRQNQELHAALVSFTQPGDKQLEDAQLDDSTYPPAMGGAAHLLHRPHSSPKAATSEATLRAGTPHKVPSALRSPAASPSRRAAAASVVANMESSTTAFTHPAASPSSASSGGSFNFPQPSSTLSTLHLPASFVTSKLRSYILWILEHKQILENMLARKEKLRKELEEQIVVANVEARVAAEGAGVTMTHTYASPTTPIRMRSSMGSPSHFQSGGPSGSPTAPSALPPPTLLLPSLLQHTLHDLHELAHLTQHDALQFAHFEREQLSMLKQCSSEGFNTYNQKRVRAAWIAWRHARQKCILRRQLLGRILQRSHLRQLAFGFSRFSTGLLVQRGEGLMKAQRDELKSQTVSTLLRRHDASIAQTQRLHFLLWITNARRKKRLKARLCAAVEYTVNNRVMRLWNRWKESTLQWRAEVAVEQGQADSEAQAAAHRAACSYKLHKFLSRLGRQSDSKGQRSVFVAWRSWARNKRLRKRQAVRRMAYHIGGQGMLTKVWGVWKAFRAGHERADANNALAQVQHRSAVSFQRQQECFMRAYVALRDRYRSFKLFHWWRLAYVDTRWMAREEQWRAALQGQKSLHISTLVRLHKQCNFLPAFHLWRKKTKQGKQARIRACGRIFQRLTNMQKEEAFRRWVEFLQRSRRQEISTRLHSTRVQLQESKSTFARRLVLRWRRQHLSHAFLALREATQARRARKRDLLDRTVRRITAQKVWNAFRQWQLYAERRGVEAMQGQMVAQKQRFAGQLIAQWRMGLITPAFAAWRERVAVRKVHRREVLDRTCKRWIHALTWRALRTWKSFAEQEATAEVRRAFATHVHESKKKRCQELIKRWRLGSLVPAWTQWQTFVAVRKSKKRELLDRTCRRMAHAALWRAFKTWTSFSEKSAVASLQHRMLLTSQQAAEQRLRLAEHMLTQWRSNRRRVRFIAWRTWSRQNRAHKRHVLERTLRHLTSGFLARGFTQWKKFVDESRTTDMRALINQHKAQQVKAALLKWRHRGITTTFIHWRHTARQARSHKRDVLDRMVRHFTHSGLSHAFRTWGSFVERGKVALMRQRLMRDKAGLQDEVALQKQKRIVALVQRWRGASLTTRFQQWRIYARTNRSKKKGRLGQILSRMVWGSLWRAWRQWKDFNELHRAREEHVRHEGTLLALRIQSERDVHSLRLRHLLTKSLDRMTHRMLFRAWSSWIDFRGASRTNEVIRAKSKLEQQAVQMAARHTQLVQEQAAVALANRRRILDKTLRRIAHASVWKALRQWKRAVEERNVFDMQRSMKAKEATLKLRLLTTKISSHRQAILRPLLVRWGKYVRAREERKVELIDSMVRRIARVRLWQTLRHWASWSQDRAVEALRNEWNHKLVHQKRARCRELIQSWRQRSMHPTFVAWVSFTRANQLRRKELAKVLARLTHLKLHNSFRHWRKWSAMQSAAVQRSSRQKLVLDRTLKRMCVGLLESGWRTWLTYTAQHRQHQVSTSLRLLRTTAVESKLASLLRRNVKRVFLSWRTYSRTQRSDRATASERASTLQREVLDRAVRRMESSALRHGWNQWRTWVMRDRLSVNDKLAEYSQMILDLRARTESDQLKLHEYVSENHSLKSHLISVKHKQQTIALLHEKQREQRAVLFAHHSCLTRHFRAFHARCHFLKRRKLHLHKALSHLESNALLRALQLWHQQNLRHRSAMTQHALESARKQLDQVLGKVWSLEAQLAARAAESDSVAAEAQQLHLNAQAAELNHQLERQMPSERELALAQEVDTMAAKLELLLKEVKERGSHIQFLSAENQRLSTLVKSSGPVALGFAPGSSDLGASNASSIASHTLNLSSSFARSRGRADAGATPMASAHASIARFQTGASRSQGPVAAGHVHTPAAATAAPSAAVPPGHFFPAQVSFS